MKQARSPFGHPVLLAGMSRITAALLFISCLGCGRTDHQGVPLRQAIQNDHSEGTDFKDCPPEGTPGSDTPLNLQKNRDAAPEHYETMNINDILATTSPELRSIAGMHRTDWPKGSAEQKRAVSKVQSQEKRGVMIEGHLLMARESGPESCNCRRDDLRDWHMWIGSEKATSFEDAKQKRRRSIVVEPTPRWQDRKGWRLRQLQALARQSARVRVYGWLLWDQEHPEETPEMKGDNATRGTLWEIHPVTKIEIRSGERWVELMDQYIR